MNSNNTDNGSGLYVHLEHPQTKERFKKRLPRLSSAIRKNGLAMSLPMTREPFRGKAPARTITLSLPLKGVGVSSVPQLREQYARLAAPVKGSLFEFVAAVITSGFVIYEKNALAVAAQQRYSNQDFVTELEEAISTAAVNGDYSAVCAFLKTRPRGANATWDHETLTTHVARTFGKQESQLSFCEEVASAISASEAKSWSRVTTMMLSEAVVHSLRAYGDARFSAGQLLEACADSEIADPTLKRLAGKRTIAWHGQPSAAGTLSDEWFVHQAIAASASQTALVTPSASDVSARLVTNGTYNGLSWLLGAGLEMFATQDSAAIASVLNAPLQVVKSLQSMATPIYESIDGSWGQSSEYRNYVGSALESFLQLYWQRLDEISDYVNQVASAVEHPLSDTLWAASASRLFYGIGDAAAIRERLNALPQRCQAIQTKIAQARGGDVSPEGGDFEQLEQDLSEIRDLGSILRMMLNNIRQCALDAEAATDEAVKVKLQGLAEACAFPEELKDALEGKIKGANTEEDAPAVVGKLPPFSPPRLNRFSRRRIASEEAYSSAVQLLDQSLSWLEGFAPRATTAKQVLTSLRQREDRHHQVRGHRLPNDQLDSLAARKLFDEWFAFWRNLSEPCRDYAFAKLKGLAGNLASSHESRTWPTIANDFIYKRKGTFYRSLYSRSWHKAYSVDEATLRILDFDELLGSMSVWAEARQEAGREAKLDWVRIRCKLANLYAKGIMTNMTSKDADPRLTAPDGLEIVLYRREKFALTTEGVTPEAFQRIVSRVEVAIRTVADLTVKEDFVEKYALKPLSTLERLVYVPRLTDKKGANRRWSPPPRLLEGTSAAAAALQVIWDKVSADGKMTTAEAVYKEICGNLKESGMRALLAELPHTWGWEVSLTGFDSTRAIACEKGQSLSVKKNELVRNKAIRVATIEAPRDWLNRLDGILRGVSANGAGQIVAELTSKAGSNTFSSRLILQQPLTSEIEQREPGDFYDRLIGIDLGERGIGFCVRDIKAGVDAEPLAKGIVPIPAIRKLIAATAHYRKKHQRQGKNGRASFVNFDEMRDAVAGNVRSVINYLMWHYRGLPVFEAEVSNLDKEQRQLSHIYTSVIASYTYQGVKTLDAKREHIWRGRHFAHPDYELVTGRGKKEKRKPFNLHPGSTVSAYGTSQECASCGVNVSSLIKDAGMNKFLVSQGGVLSLEGVDIGLFKIGAIRKGERLPLEARTIRKAELLKHIAEQRRLPAPNGGKDTTRSRFLCPVRSCPGHQQTVHADANASDNIVKRKLRRMVAVQ